MTTESNNMDVDEVEGTHHKTEIENQNPNPNENSNNKNHPENAVKRRKKRTREQMETDAKNAIITKTQNTVKRRKLTTKPSKPSKTSKPSNATPIEPIPQKWQTKFSEYQAIIISTHKVLQKEINCGKKKNTSLFGSEKVQNDLSSFAQKISANDIDFDEYIALFCRLCYAQNETVSTLISNIKNILLQNTTNIADSLKNTLKDKLRNIILNSGERKIYGIKPSKSVSKTEENIANDIDSWNKCRMYQWEPHNMQYIDEEYQLDRREIKKYSLIINKYGAFCRKYESLLHNIRKSMQEKENELQKLDDNIVSWKGKEEANKQKQKQKEQEMKERRFKKEEMDKARKAKTEKKKKEKEERERLKREKEKEKMEKEELKKEKVKLKKQKEVQIPVIPEVKIKQRKPSFMDQFFTAKAGTQSPKIGHKKTAITAYERVFKPPQLKHVLVFKDEKSDLMEINDHRLYISDKVRCPRPSALPPVFVDRNNDNIDNMVSRMNINNTNCNNDNDNKMKLQCKFRCFCDDNVHRRCFFGIDKRYCDVEIDVDKLRRNPFCRINEGINYSESDSDVDDLEDCDDLDEVEDDVLGNLRSDGYEIDTFIVNSEDDEDGEALNDKDMMQNMTKSNELRKRLKDEYPIKFIHKRQRGDRYDQCILIKLPMIKNMKCVNKRLYDLTMNKTQTALDDRYDVDVKHEEKDNDLAQLLEIENKGLRESEEKKKKKKEKKKKKKRKEKERKEKERKEKEKKKQKEKEKKKKVSMKMEMDDDGDDVDSDVKMTENNTKTPKKIQRNTLNKYFKQTPKGNCVKKILNQNEKDKMNGNDEKSNQEKNKKRRVVMCQLIE